MYCDVGMSGVQITTFFCLLVWFGIMGPYLLQNLVRTLKFAKLAYTPATDS